MSYGGNWLYIGIKLDPVSFQVHVWGQWLLRKLTKIPNLICEFPHHLNVSSRNCTSSGDRYRGNLAPSENNVVFFLQNCMQLLTFNSITFPYFCNEKKAINEIKITVQIMKQDGCFCCHVLIIVVFHVVLLIQHWLLSSGLILKAAGVEMYWNFCESELTEFLQANCKLLRVSGYMERNIF